MAKSFFRRKSYQTFIINFHFIPFIFFSPLNETTKFVLLEKKNVDIILFFNVLFFPSPTQSTLLELIQTRNKIIDNSQPSTFHFINSLVYDPNPTLVAFHS